jgi:uncharacterized protein
MTLLRVWAWVLAGLLLAGCAAGPGSRAVPEEAAMAEALYREGNFAAAAQAFLDAAEASRGGRDLYRLRAAEAWRENGNPELARGLLDGLDARRLDAEASLRLALLRAELALGDGDYAGARRALDAIVATPPAAYRGRVLELRGRAAERSDPFYAARVYAELGTLLDGADKRDNARRIRDLLAGLRDSALRNAATGLRGDDALRPYVVRALTARGFSVPPQLQRAPQRPDAAPAPVREQGEHVALLLPLSGPLAPAGSAVRDGFLAARLGEPNATVKVSVVDSGDSPAAAIAAYRQAVAGGATAVVGPLTREAVAALFAESDLPRPILALNRSGGGVPAGQLSFALAPEEEGAAIAARLQQRGLVRVLAVASSDDASQRALAGLRQRLERSGGQLIATVSVDERAIDFQQPIRDTLTAAGLPTSAPQELSEPHDPGFDAVFVAVRAPAARLLVPQLKLFGLSQVPMLATSLVHAVGGDARMDRELSEVEFCDAPWLIDEVPGLPARRLLAQQLETARGPAARLFAFGMDAWRLWLLQRSGDTSMAIPGATGMLSIDDLGEAQRDPGIAVFRGGLPRRVLDGELIPDAAAQPVQPQG